MHSLVLSNWQLSNAPKAAKKLWQSPIQFTWSYAIKTKQSEAAEINNKQKANWQRSSSSRRRRPRRRFAASAVAVPHWFGLLNKLLLLPPLLPRPFIHANHPKKKKKKKMLALSCCFGDSVRLLLTVFFALVFGSFFWSRARAKIRKILFCFYFVCLLSHSLSHSLSLSLAERAACLAHWYLFIF